MGFVTGLTIFEIRRRMHINFGGDWLLFCPAWTLPVTGPGLIIRIRIHSGFQIGVTGQAQIRIIRQEKIFQIGFMGAVALRAFTIHDRVVLAFDVLDFPAGVRAVAGVTQKSLFGDNHPVDIASVYLMAFQTFTVFKIRVVGAALSRFHQVSMATDAQLRIVSICQKEIFVGRSMGSVAVIAIALNDRFVGIGF